uniref:glycosyltransferase n=1 Tax=Campylobacter coli TaxID=195 RepID=UPI003CFAFC34
MAGSNQWTLISVSYNSGEALRRFWLDAALPHSVRWIVVDNASTDDSVSVARAAGAEVIQLSENIGFGAANNLGFEQADSPYVGFVNPDVRVDFDSLP